MPGAHPENISRRVVGRYMRSVIKAAAKGEETAIDYIQDNAARVQKKLIGTNQRTATVAYQLSEEMIAIANKQLTNGLSAWTRRMVADPDFERAYPYTITQSFAHATLDQARLLVRFQQAASGDEEAWTYLRERIQNNLQRRVLKIEREDILSQAQEKLARSLPDWIVKQTQRTDFTYRNLPRDVYVYVRSIPNSIIVDERRHKKALENQRPPKPTHDIRYVFPDFPLKEKEERQEDYELRMESFLQKIGFPISMSEYRVKLLSLRVQGKSNEEVAEALGGQHSVYSIAATTSIIRSAFEEYIFAQGLYRPAEFAKPPYTTSAKVLYKDVQRGTCEGMIFMNGYYYKKEWIDERVKNKGRRVRRTKG